MEPALTKAKSRLTTQSAEPAGTVVARVSPIPQTNEKKQPLHTHHEPKTKQRFEKKKLSQAFVLSKRLQYVPLLILSLAFYSILGYIFSNVYPEKIANILFFHSYLPIVVLFLFATFFLCSFLLLHTRRAFLVSMALTLLLFLKFQDVSLSLPLLAIDIAFFAVFELFASFFFRK